MVQLLVSIENNEDWFNRVNTKILSNTKLLFVKENKNFPGGSDGTIDEFKDYVYKPLEFVADRKFDIILIDGRARVGCASICKQLGHKDTVVFIHDYNHPDPQFTRHEYFEAEKYLKPTGQVYSMCKFNIIF